MPQAGMYAPSNGHPPILPFKLWLLCMTHLLGSRTLARRSRSWKQIRLNRLFKECFQESLPTKSSSSFRSAKSAHISLPKRFKICQSHSIRGESPPSSTTMEPAQLAGLTDVCHTFQSQRDHNPQIDYLMNQEIENLWLKMNRRQALRTVGAGLGYMALGSLLADGSTTAGKFSHHPARAKRLFISFSLVAHLRSIFLIINQHSLSTTAVIFSNMLNNRPAHRV